MPSRFDHGDVTDADAPVDPIWHPADIPSSSEPAQASVVLGAVFTLGSVPTVQLIHVLWSGGFRGFDRTGVQAAAIAGCLIGLFALACSAIGFVFGVRGMMAARRQARSVALSLAGALLSFFAFWLWVGIAICWIDAMTGRL